MTTWQVCCKTKTRSTLVILNSNWLKRNMTSGHIDKVKIIVVGDSGMIISIKSEQVSIYLAVNYSTWTWAVEPKLLLKSLWLWYLCKLNRISDPFDASLVCVNFFSLVIAEYQNMCCFTLFLICYVNFSWFFFLKIWNFESRASNGIYVPVSRLTKIQVI